jgi:hypothetical protein
MQQKKVKLDNLYFDPDNFRYDFDFDFIKTDQNRIKNKSNQLRASKSLSGDINDLKKSIIANDFIYNEMIIVKPIDDEENYVVVEGNRRLASLKKIQEEYAIEDLKPSLRKIMEEGLLVNVTTEEDGYDDDILMGMRHVTGTKPWGGFSKAKLIVKLKDNKGFSFEEISNRLGGRVPEIKKRYNSYKLLEKMSEDGYASDDIAGYYTLFYEALGKPAYQQFLGWDNSLLEFTNKENVERFYTWITPQEEEDGGSLPAIITNPNELRQVAQILNDNEVLEVMEDRRDVFAAVKSSTLIKNKEVKKHILNLLKGVKEISIGDVQFINSEDTKILIEIKDLIDNLIKFKQQNPEAEGE